MPVVGDLPVLDAIYINCAKANRATVAFHVFEAAAEMSREGVPNNGAIVRNVLGFTVDGMVRIFCRECDAASSMRAATSFGLET